MKTEKISKWSNFIPLISLALVQTESLYCSMREFRRAGEKTSSCQVKINGSWLNHRFIRMLEILMLWSFKAFQDFEDDKML